MVVFVFFFSFLFDKSHSPRRKKKIFEKQKRKTNLDEVSTQKGHFLDQGFDSTTYIYVYIYRFTYMHWFIQKYIYICRRVSFGTTFLAFQELETVPPF